ncbi:MAG: cell surface protein SprA, partial [candidate division Zixibacteria bacterium]|nr:cell surface protein SprA [candidate division Zixibacteria bacterium]
MSHSAFKKILSLRSASTITFLVLSVLLLLPELALPQSLWVSLNKSGFRHLNFYHKSAPPGLSITQRRQPLLSTKFKVSRNTVFFAEKRRVKIDYTEGGYRLYEPLYIPLDNYIGYGIEYASKRAWEEDLYKAQLKEETDKEGGLLEYEIPIKFPKMVRSIIGEGGPGLKVNGYRKIAFTGKSEWDSGVQSTAAYKQSKFPTLAMEQESKFTITGTIGDKITVKVEQDSKALSDLENRIHLKYTGYDDEIVKSIEAGNTNLSLPNTQFVGYSESVQGLFGIKAEAQVGNLDITVITSQEKGSTEKTTFNAGAQGSQETIRDYDYLRRTYFSIDQVGELQAGDSISFINLYINSDQQEKARGIAVVAPTEGEQPSQEQNIRGEWKYHNFEILEPNTYTIEREQHYIILNNSLSSSQTLACYMEIKKPDGTIDTIGNEDYNVEGDTTYVLKLIWKPNADSSYSTWENEWRNVYNLRSVKIEPDGFELNIYRGVRGGEDPLTDSSEYKGTPIIQLLGLDKEDNDRNATPDNIVDPFYVDFYHGHLIFPYDFRNPFNATVFEPEDRVPEIYESDNQSAIQEASKYYFLVKTTNRASQFSLGHTNIIEGSEVVRMNGRTLQKGKDYNIMYELGQITFLTDEASDPNANITIDYEFAPFFMPERKSLFGSRLVYNFGEQNWIGTTALYKSEATADQKPRVGREPTRNFVWDTDLSLKFEPELMTRMTDALPFVETEASSQVSIQAEFAQSIPNSNTKGLAYIDDFESSREYFDLSIFRGPWTLSSQPVSLDQDIRRSQMWWYNPYDQVRLTDIWPNREVKESENRTNILEIKYFPDIEDSADSWAGLMRRMPLGLQDQTRTKFIEIWMRNPTGHDIEMHVDLGVISEDINNNTVLDTEDRLKNGFRDGILDDDEDTGLDGVVNSAEDSTNTYISSFYNPNATDKHLDNWNYDNRDDYSRINGTEGNREDPDKGRRPDTEDINNSGGLDLNNGYFSFGFSLNDDTFLADSSFKDGVATGWKLYRIPLQDSLLYIREGSPKWNLIESARIWFTGADTIVTLQIAQLQLVGNKWQEMGIASSNPSTNPILPSESFGITVKNSQENSDYYPPPGIVVEKDPTSNLKRKEQSLVMQFEDLLPGHSASAYRVLYSAEDYSNYNQMDMYIYGRDMDDPEDLTFFFRMGTDTVNNFYEYRVNVSEGWAESNRMEIDFTELTALKNYMILNNDG